MIASLHSWMSFWMVTDDTAAADRRRQALQQHFSGSTGGGETMMALLWMVAVLALAVLVLVIFERHRRARRKPDPRKLGADLLAAHGMGEGHQHLLTALAAAGRIDPPTLLMFSEPTFRAAAECYVRQSADAAEQARRRHAAAALAASLFAHDDAAPAAPAASGSARPTPRAAAQRPATPSQHA